MFIYLRNKFVSIWKAQKCLWESSSFILELVTRKIVFARITNKTQATNTNSHVDPEQLIFENRFMNLPLRDYFLKLKYSSLIHCITAFYVSNKRLFLGLDFSLLTKDKIPRFELRQWIYWSSWYSVKRLFQYWDTLKSVLTVVSTVISEDLTIQMCLINYLSKTSCWRILNFRFL